jgi:hypothetical protein
LNKATTWLLVLGALMLIACGGGGPGTPDPTGGGNGGNGGSGGVGHRRIEATLVSDPSIIVDLRNIQVGEPVQLHVVSYSEQGVRTVLGGVFGTAAPSNVATVSAAGVLQPHSPTSQPFVVNGNFGGIVTSAQFEVKPMQAVVRGLTRLNGSGAPVPWMIVEFYNAAGTRVGLVRSAHNGTFRASVPPSATGFTVDVAASDPPRPGGVVTYYRQFGYGPFDYARQIANCLAPLPPLTTGQTTQLPHHIVLYFVSGQSPPPPPDGCFFGP